MRAPRGIAKAQARKLARLQRKLGLPFTGRGMTAREAWIAIEHARRALAVPGDGGQGLRRAKARRRQDGEWEVGSPGRK